MIKLFSLKQQKKDGEATPKSGNQKKASAAQLRITKGENLILVIPSLAIFDSSCLNYLFES